MRKKSAIAFFSVLLVVMSGLLIGNNYFSPHTPSHTHTTPTHSPNNRYPGTARAPSSTDPNTAQSSQFPSPAIVGYIDNSYWTPTTADILSQDNASKYNIFIFGFGSVNSDNTADINLFSDPNKSSLQSNIDTIHSMHKLVLLSFGGATDSFNATSSSDFTTIATNIESLLQQYDFDGIDLDLESQTATFTAVDIQTLISTLRANNPDIIITGAPQIANDSQDSSKASFSPAIWADSDTLKIPPDDSPAFDALLVQDYNQGPGVSFNGLYDTDVGFLTASFNALLATDTPTIPTDTKIIIGTPASTEAGTGLTPEQAAQDIQGGDILNNSRFGGMMTWSLIQEYNGSWNWINNIYPVLYPNNQQPRQQHNSR